MAVSSPSDEVKALMETMRHRQKEGKLRALEEQRILEVKKRIWEEEEAKKVHQSVIQAEVNMRLDIENYDETVIQHIKNTIKSFPNVHIIELRDMISCHNNNDYGCSSSDCGVCSVCICRLCIWNHYSDDPVLLKRQKSIKNKRKETFYEYIDQCVKEIQEEAACKNELNKLEAQTKLRSDIAKANKALPSNKINGGEFEEGRLEIEYVISLDNPNPGLDTRASGLYFETRHLSEHMNTQLQNKRIPRSKEIPVSWNNDYKNNKIPFLPQCPVCSGQNTILFKWSGSRDDSGFYYTNMIDTVGCFPHSSHYTWDSNTKKHSMRTTCNDSNCTSEYYLKEWNPLDPDDSMATAEKKQKEIEEIQKQIRELHAKLASL